MKLAAVFLIAALVPICAVAQTVTDSFGELNQEQVLKEGDTLWITGDWEGQGEYRELEGEFVGLTDLAVIVRNVSFGGPTDLSVISSSSVRGETVREVEIPESRVRRVEWQRGDPIWPSAFIGSLVGAATGAVPFAALCANEGGRNCPEIIFAFGGLGAAIGAGIGAGFDALIHPSRELVYRTAGSDASFTFKLSPSVSNDRKELLFSVRW